MSVVRIAGCAMLSWHFLVHWCTHFPWLLATLLHRHLDRDLSWHLDTLSDRSVMAHLLRDRSCYCGAVCAGHRYTHRDRHTVGHSHLTRGLYRNLLALPLCMSLALRRMLVIGCRCWMSNMRSSMANMSSTMSNMRSSSLKKLSICISFRYGFWVGISFTFSQMMSILVKGC